MNNLKNFYETKVKKELQKKFKYESSMQIPKLQKIVLNMTAGRHVADSKHIEAVANELALISGQKPMETIAKRSLASWKLREGMPMGSKVTLRREKMWDFLEKLIHISIPRIRDFRGIELTRFDGSGNFALGIKEQIIFPEIDFDKVKSIKGLDVIIVTSAKTDDEAKVLLKELGMPFKKG